MERTTSAEKDEKVDKPPKKPVIMKRRHGSRTGITTKIATAIPIK